MYAFRGSFRKKFRQALGLEKSEFKHDSPVGSSVGFHVRADTPEQVAEKFQTSGNPLNDVKAGEIEIKPTERARELLAGEVATVHDLRDAITGMVERAGTQKVVAAELGISTSTIGDVLHGKRGIGGKVIRNLGWEKVVVFRRK